MNFRHAFFYFLLPYKEFDVSSVRPLIRIHECKSPGHLYKILMSFPFLWEDYLEVSSDSKVISDLCGSKK